jgi:hypothetical protein
MGKPGKRRRAWLTVALLVVAAIIGAFLILAKEPRIGQANFDRVQLGWTETQVSELLGNSKSEFGATFVWSDEDDNMIFVDFDAGHRVFDKRFSPNTLPFPERQYRRLRRQIRSVLGLSPEP